MEKNYKEISPTRYWNLFSGIVLLLMITGLLGLSNLNAQLWNVAYCSGLPSITQSSIYGPMYSTATANATSRHAVIYPSSQLAGISGQMLTSIYFHTGSGNSNGMLGTPNFKIYLKEVSAVNWGTGALDWATAIAGATLVYDSDPSAAIGTSGGWKQFQLSTNFNYSGTQNLALFTEYQNPTASNAITWSYDYTSPCVSGSSTGTETKYSNNTTGTLPTSLGSTNSRRPYIAFDFPVACPAPNNVVVSNITTNSFTANWTAGGSETSWDYALVPAGSAVPTTFTTVTTPTVTLSTLTVNTNYDFYVRAKCGGTNGDSFLKGPYSFKTLCGPATTLFENFDSYATGSIVPDCWERLTAPTGSGSQSITSTTPYSGTRNLYMYASSTQSAVTVVLPELSNINAGTHWLRLRARVSSATGQLHIGYVTDATDPNTFMILQTLSIQNTSYDNTSEYTVVVPASVPATARLAILNNTDAKSYYIDDVYWEPVPTCIGPTGITSTTQTTNSVTLSWNPSVTTVANGYTVYYSTTNVAPDATTVLDGSNSMSVTGTTATVSGLDPNTTYFFWVRANCSATDTSAWIAGGDVTTLCGPATYMYENFDSYPTGSIVPNCWARLLAATSSGSQTISSSTPYSGTRNLYMYASSTQSAVTVVLPEFSNINAGTHWLRLRARVSSATGQLHIGYVTDATDPNTFMILQTLSIQNTSYDNTSEYTVVVPASVPATARLAILNNTDAKSYYIDDVYWESVPTCIGPTGITSTTQTTNSVTLSWNPSVTTVANGYTVYYSTTNVAPDATTVLDGSNSMSVTGTTATVSGLDPNTTYFFWVRANCSATDTSAWIAGGDVTTLCGPATYMYENFDSYPTGSIVPNCWARLLAATSSGSQTISSSTPFSGNRNLYMYASSSSNPVTVVLPEFSNINAGTHWLRLRARVGVATGQLNVGYVTNPADASTFVILQTLTIANTAYDINSEYTVAVPASVPATARLAIQNSADAKAYYFDDVYWEPAPSCLAPTAVTTSGYTQTGATVSWTASASTPANYTVYFSTTNVAPDATTVLDSSNSVTVTGTTATLSALSPNTTYYVWVRSNCSATDMSTWAAATPFTTLCVAFAVPFNESFSTGSLPNCWSNFSTNNASYALWRFSGSPDYGTTNNGLAAGTYAWVDASSPYSGVHDVTLQSPEINLAGLTVPMVQFKWFKFHASSSTGTTQPAYDNNKLTVMVKSTTGTTWETIFADSTNDPSWRTVSIDLPASYVGTTIQIRFIVDKDVAGNGYFYDNILLDDVAVIQSVLATDDIAANNSTVTVYPNPFTDVIQVTDSDKLVKLTVIDASGRQVKVLDKPGTRINLGDLKSGMYILKLDYKDGVSKTAKVIKK